MNVKIKSLMEIEKNASDHLKKVPICGYAHEISAVEPSRSNYTNLNLEFQTANGQPVMEFALIKASIIR